MASQGCMYYPKHPKSSSRRGMRPNKTDRSCSGPVTGTFWICVWNALLKCMFCWALSMGWYRMCCLQQISRDYNPMSLCLLPSLLDRMIHLFRNFWKVLERRKWRQWYTPFPLYFLFGFAKILSFNGTARFGKQQTQLLVGFVKWRKLYCARF